MSARAGRPGREGTSRGGHHLPCAPGSGRATLHRLGFAVRLQRGLFRQAALCVGEAIARVN
jgi:hypothetical protein